MNTRSNQWIPAGISVIMLAACGGGGGGGSAPARTSDADGEWQLPCMFNAEDADYESERLTIANGEFTLVQSAFSDASCSNLSQEVSITGTFVEGNQVSVADGDNATEIDLTTTALSLTFHTDALVAMANGVSLCGTTAWSSGVSRDVSNCSDIDNTDVPRVQYDIYRRAGSQLFVGTEAADTSAQRPLTLDLDDIYELSGTTLNNNDPDSNQPGGVNGDPVLPEESLALTASNNLLVSQFAVEQLNLVKGLTNAGNTGVVSGANMAATRLTDLYLSSFCDGSGSVSASATPAILVDVTVTYSDCVIDSKVYAGQMQMRFASVVGAPGDYSANWSYSAQVNMNNFMIQSAEGTLRLTGDFILTMVYMADTEVAGGATARFQGIQDEEIYIYEDDAVARMQDFDFVFAYRNNSPSPYTDSFDEARIASSRIGGQISVREGIFSGFDRNIPASGELSIFGANGSTALIEVLDTDLIDISVDADGNGEYTDTGDRVTNTNWLAAFGA